MVRVVIGSSRIEAADFDSFGGLNKRFISQIDGYVRYPLGAVVAAGPPEEQEVAFFQFGKVQIERHFCALADLFARIAIQFDTVHQKR